MTRKKIWLGLGACVIAGLVALIFFSGSLVKPMLELAIRQAGFPNANIESVYVIPNGLLLENVYLDADAFSTIDTAQVTGSWLDIILKRKISSIELKNVALSGEIDEQGRYVIAGWDAGLSSNTGSSGILIENLALNGMTLDFETPEGAIRIEGKLALQSTADKTRNFQANLWGKQKQLALNATASGKIQPDGQWNSDIELLEGRIDMDSIKATRAAGTVALKSVPAGIIYQGKMAAGGVRIQDIPFQDFEVAFDSNKPDILNFKTSPTGYNSIILQGRLTNKQPLTLEASATVKNLNDVAQLFSLKKSDLSWLNKTTPLELKATTPLSELSAPHIPVSWSLTAGENRQSFAGAALYDRETATFSGTLNPASVSATTLSNLLPLKDKQEINLTEGAFKLNGAFICKLSEEPLKIGGALTLDVQKVGGMWRDYPFNQVEGTIKLGSLYPWAFDKSQTLTIGTIGTGINLTSGSVSFEGGQDSGISVTQSGFTMAGGKLSTDPFVWKSDAKENALTVRLENISLMELATTIAANGFAADGLVSGSLPMVFTKDGIIFKDGILSSAAGGSFRYTPAAFPAALQGDDARMTTVRQALSDFRYSALEVSVSGNLGHDLKTTFKASGKNPLFGDRPINLNINLEGALVPALQQALQPGQIADRIEKSVTGEP